jgi:predicted transcriptional regulator
MTQTEIDKQLLGYYMLVVELQLAMMEEIMRDFEQVLNEVLNPNCDRAIVRQRMLDTLNNIQGRAQKVKRTLAFATEIANQKPSGV